MYAYTYTSLQEIADEIVQKLTEKLRTNHGDDLTKLLSFLSLSGK